jgi:hypothetical protein
VAASHGIGPSKTVSEARYRLGDDGVARSPGSRGRRRPDTCAAMDAGVEPRRRDSRDVVLQPLWSASRRSGRARGAGAALRNYVKDWSQ